MTKQERTERVFMDKVDWDHEVCGAMDGNKVYPTEDDCARECDSHIDECGMVEIEMRFIRVVRPGKHR